MLLFTNSFFHFRSISSFRGDLLKHVRSKHSDNSAAILKKLKQKISGPSKVLKTIDNIESRFGRDSQPPVLEDTSAIKSCAFCDFSCRFKKSLQQHLRRKHPGAEQPVSNGVAEANDLACPHCPFKARNNQILEKHVSVKHKKAFANGSIEPEGKIASRKGLPAKPSGDSTVRTVCPDFRCPSCDFKASKFILVAQHIRKSHQKNSAAILKQLKSIKRFACPECPLRSRFKVNIERHLSKLHPGSRSKALMVEATSGKKKESKISATVKESNTRDELADEAPPSKKVKIKRTDENRQSPENDLTGSDSAKPSAQLSCSKCPFVAKSHPDLISHFDKAHLKRGSDRRCPHCGYKTTLSVLLNSHVVTSHSKNSSPKPSNSNFNIWQLFG